jgi:hypothetical protein
MLLDEKELGEQMVLIQDGKEEPEKLKVETTILTTLQAVAELHKQDPKRDLSALLPSIKDLERSSDPAIATEAKKTLLALRG